MTGTSAVLAVAVAALAALQGAAAQAAAVAGAGGAAALAGNALALAPIGTKCASSVQVSPWDLPGKFPDVTVCCGGSIDFQWNGNSAVWQTATPACPVTFVNGTAARPLIAPAVGSGGVKSLYLPVPGNYYLTSPVAGACAGGLKFLAQVPPQSGTVCPAGTETQISTGPGSQAAAQGTPGGTSTSTGRGSAASASGPPGTSYTATGPGQAFSSSGGRRMLRWDEAF